MSYQILRTKKLTEFNNIKLSAAHNFREMFVPNADPSRTNLNKTIGAKTGEELVRKWQSRVDSHQIKVRNKKTVKIIEFLITASPDFFKSTKIGNDYFDASIKWLTNKFGSDNILSINFQYDEKTPHLVAYVMPELCNKLNAKHYLGSATKLSFMQDNFYKSVSLQFKLERGLKNTKIKYSKLENFHKVANSSIASTIIFPVKGLLGYSTDDVDNLIAQVNKTNLVLAQNRLFELEVKNMKKIKKAAELAQQNKEITDRENMLLLGQNQKLMQIVSKLIFNFDPKIKIKNAEILKLEKSKNIIEQHQKSKLHSTNEPPTYDSIIKIINIYDQLKGDISLGNEFKLTKRNII